MSTITGHGLTVEPVARREPSVPRVRRSLTPLAAINPTRRDAARALGRIAPVDETPGMRFNAGI